MSICLCVLFRRNCNDIGRDINDGYFFMADRYSDVISRQFTEVSDSDWPSRRSFIDSLGIVND